MVNKDLLVETVSKYIIFFDNNRKDVKNKRKSY